MTNPFGDRTPTDTDSNPQQLSFEAEFLKLLHPNSSEGRLILSFIERSLRQFHLQGFYASWDILTEVYLRGLKAVQRGETIQKLKPWIQSTAYNYIRELSREWRKSIPIVEGCHYECDHLSTLCCLSQLMQKEQQRIEKSQLCRAFEQLASDEQDLLILKVIQGLTWKEIQNRAAYQEFNLPQLRKRKQRVLDKFIRIYHALEED
ncbi:MAG: sigma-70 family RNA polymerase sigma factor [Microcoleaceae cyanobacterium]